MRYREIVSEAIPNAPRNLPAYLKARIRDADQCLADLRAAEELIQANRDGEDLLVRFLRYGTDYADAADDLHALLYLSGERGFNDRPRIERYLPIENLRDCLKNYLEYGQNFFSYLHDAWKYAEAIDERARGVMAILHTAEAGARIYGYDGAAGHDEEYDAAMGLLAGLRRLVSVIQRIEALWSDIKSKIDVIAQRRAMAYSGKDYRPQHESEETLYHASIHAAELATQGFQAEKPRGRTGVGSFGDQSNISFTHDYKIAHDIVRALRELWMIAHGQVTTKQILGWMESEGIDYKSPQFLSTLSLKSTTEIKTPEQVAKLYNLYLWHTKLRSNPVFANLDDLISQLKNVELKDIGIVACEVKLTAQDEYLSGESEFRVSADRVLSVKRVQ